jgi:hypothetical protein
VDLWQSRGLVEYKIVRACHGQYHRRKPCSVRADS